MVFVVGTVAYTLYPFLIKRRAEALPIPEDAPVIRTIFFSFTFKSAIYISLDNYFRTVEYI